MALLDDDRLFDAEPKARGMARALYAGIRDLPLVSPHGHTEPRWYAENAPFPDPAQLLIVPDHYVFRMLFSQGIRLEDLGVPTTDGSVVETDGRTIWRLFARHYHLFRGTPTRMWFDHTLSTLFGVTERLGEANADAIYDRIASLLANCGTGFSAKLLMRQRSRQIRQRRREANGGRELDRSRSERFDASA